VTLTDPEAPLRHLEHLVRSASFDRDAELCACAFRGLRRSLELQTDRGPQLPVVWRELRRWMEQHSHEELQLDELAARVELGRSRFCQCFQAFFGQPPMHFVQELRLERARWLLRDHERSVAGIAREVGYADVAYFSRLMRRRFGEPPSRLRER
jgi:transcriptional regulator GlxA family with amidase domain